MSPKSGERQGIALIIVRYGLGTVLLMAGVVLLAVNPGGFGVDGFGMAAGAGLSVLLLNFCFASGVATLEEEQAQQRRRRAA